MNATTETTDLSDFLDQLSKFSCHVDSAHIIDTPDIGHQVNIVNDVKNVLFLG